MKYRINFAKNFHKKKTKTKTSIIFDKNDPIITNYATTRFSPGLSVGVRTGYSWFSKLNKAKSYFLGYTISPYKSYKWYWQIENSIQKLEYIPKSKQTEELIQNNTGQIKQLQTTSSSFETQRVSMQIPALIRYNLTNYFSIGGGVQAQFNLYEKTTTWSKTNLYEGPNTNFLLKSETNNTEENSKISNLKHAFLIDVTVGAVRIGPSLGFRYHFSEKSEFNYSQVYAIWKF